MKSSLRWIVGLSVAAILVPVFSTVESSMQTRTPPPKSAPTPAPQGRKPSPDAPPARAVPRPPVSRPPTRPPVPRPPTRPPRRPQTPPPGSRTLIYPYYLDDFDFAYRFPYGVYPYSPFIYPPYEYPLPAAGCVTAEGETQGTGAVRLDIPQKEAAVYIDGFYVGAVDDFDSATEQLTLRPGPHHIELRATGYQTLSFDVDIRTGKTITYRTPMQPGS